MYFWSSEHPEHTERNADEQTFCDPCSMTVIARAAYPVLYRLHDQDPATCDLCGTYRDPERFHP